MVCLYTSATAYLIAERIELCIQISLIKVIGNGIGTTAHE
jgi:hypothetical protein